MNEKIKDLEVKEKVDLQQKNKLAARLEIKAGHMKRAIEAAEFDLQNAKDHYEDILVEIRGFLEENK